ncbi:MAG TPA: hydantoinase B/oxoprolinase family protein, partial [Chloroflexota bacterium]
VRPDSAGPGKFRGGCGQYTTFVDRSGETWSMSGMYDRLKFAAQGMLGGEAGLPGMYRLGGDRSEQSDGLNPKELLFHPAGSRVETALPGGGGYGDPFEREPSAVLDDVLNGYVSLEAAAHDYGVVIHTTQRPDEQITLPRHLSIDFAATDRLRAERRLGQPS